MTERSLLTSISAQSLDRHDTYPALSLLPPGSSIPLRYRQVCAQLQDWRLPTYIVQTGLLMRHIERGVIQPDQLAPILGAEAVEAAKALAMFSGGAPRPSLQNIERMWKLFMLTYLHPPASLLKITELLMQLRYTQDADITISAETIRAAAGVCARLGMWDVRAKLLDDQARLVDPHLAERARKFLDRSQPTRSQFFEALQQELTELLKGQGVDARIERRQRPIYQVIDDRLDSARGTFPWADVVIILIEDIQDCYRALGAINHTYPVVGAKLRDYIGGPKENGYQAIHTTVEYAATIGGNRIASVEIHITTPVMDRYNREGYLVYLAGIIAPARRPIWWDERQRWLEAYQAQSDELFVFTPEGETIFLPHGATILDFAVRVHSDLGVYCRGALVNGHRVSPGEQLKSSDICEVLIDQHSEPIDHRMLDLASTTSAKAHIRHALQKGKSGVARGRQIFKEVLVKRLEEQEIHTSETTIEQQVAAICRARGYQTVDAFYRAVARGEVAPDRAVRVIVAHLLVPRIDFGTVPMDVRTQAERIRLALCCRPRPSRPAVAMAIHNGHQLKIHDATCRNIAEPGYPVTWKPVEEQSYVVDVLYEGWDRPGLIHQVTGTINAIGAINIRTFNADVPEPSLARIRFSFEAPGKEKIEQVQHALEQLPDQRHVDLRMVTLNDEGLHIIEPLDNPYGPQPVGRWPLFVGRDGEVRKIVTLLENQSGANHILICGPKRVGKSSLLQHLSRYHLNNFKVPSLLDLQSLPTEELRFSRLLSHLSEMIIQKAEPRVKATKLDASAIEHDPIRAFGRFLADLHDPHDPEHFVVLIDELGVILSRMQGSTLEHEFFDQWRALLYDENVYNHLSFIVVLPDYSIERIGAGGARRRGEHFSFRMGELGLPIRLSVLDENNARDLITTPIRMHLAYQTDDLELLLRETGGHPYYIHLVCGHIITAVQMQQRKMGVRIRERQEISSDVVRGALEAVFGNEDAFHHVLADNTLDTSVVLRTVAALTNEAESFVSLSRLRTRLKRIETRYSETTITRALEERPDLLMKEDDRICIRAVLVARWLRSHT
jgi:(p)ppGpp synthase/HD superfamily hydrolase